MTDPHDPRRNAAWHAAQQWRERVRQARPSGILGSLKLILAWLLFGIMLIIGTVLGLFFLLIGWALLPIVRYRMKKRLERMRAEQADDIGSSVHYRETRYRESRQDGERYREQQVLEGDYEVKPDEEGKP
jgi:UPF0716 family protein affecting phage T7 exclusion